MNCNTTHYRANSSSVPGDPTAILDGDGTITYREFFERVERAAVFQQSLGLERGDRLAMLMLNSAEFLELYFATGLAGTAMVPLNTRWNLGDILFSLSDSGSKAVVVDDRFTPIVGDIRANIPGIMVIYAGRGECPEGMINYRQGVAEVTGIPTAWPEPDEQDIAGLFYTSGTTGGPKGVMLTHRNLFSNMLFGMVSGFSGRKVYLHAAPMFHLADGAAILSTTHEGGAHCFLESFDPEGFLAAVERYRVTSTILVPTMVSLVVNHPSFDKYDLSTLEYVMYGASPMPTPLLERAMAKFGCKFQQGYGMTETSPLLTLLGPEDHKLENLDEKFTPVKSAGRPIAGMEVKVVDELDRELPAREAGEIIARGANVMKGYWNRPDINREVLRGGWMHTGDIGAFDERGFLYILDRKKDMIKTGGENVYTPEVESAVLAHPAVLEAAIIGVPDERWGEAIRAVIVARPGARVTEAEIIEFCRERLTHFKCPTSVAFIDSLPKGGTGKVQKATLRTLFGSTAAAAGS